MTAVGAVHAARLTFECRAPTRLGDVQSSLRAIQYAYSTLQQFNDTLEALRDLESGLAERPQGPVTAIYDIDGVPLERVGPHVLRSHGIEKVLRIGEGHASVLSDRSSAVGFRSGSTLYLSTRPSVPLVVVRINVNSPGIWEFLGAVNPLQQLREYLKDRHERKKDAAFRDELEARKMAADAVLREAQAASAQIATARETLQLASQILGVEEATRQAAAGLLRLDENLFPTFSSEVPALEHIDDKEAARVASGLSSAETQDPPIVPDWHRG